MSTVLKFGVDPGEDNSLARAGRCAPGCCWVTPMLLSHVEAPLCILATMPKPVHLRLEKDNDIGADIARKMEIPVKQVIAIITRNHTTSLHSHSLVQNTPITHSRIFSTLQTHILSRLRGSGVYLSNLRVRTENNN